MGHTPRENYEGFFLNPYKDKEGVYAIYDSKDNLIYIGETYDFKNRIYQHIMSSHFKDLIHRIVAK
jgi:excinuclease UvrABC nuclease subunit